MSYDLNGKVALVTGCASKRGIGFATALRLAGDGANVAVADISRMLSKSAEDDAIEGWRGLDSVVATIEAEGRQGLSIIADVTQSKQVESMVNQVLEKFGKIDILVNNAGIMGLFKVPTLETDEEAIWKVLSVNLIGPFLCSKAVAKAMIERGAGGKIVNMASISGKVGIRMMVAYNMSKAGLINLTQTLALELAAHKINVNAVCPGSVATEFQSGKDIRVKARTLGISMEEASSIVRSDVTKLIPLGRVAQPEDIAQSVAFLVAEESKHITGIALNVNGGQVMAP